MPIPDIIQPKSSHECQNSLVCRNRRPLLFVISGVILIFAFLFVFVWYPKADITISVKSQPLKTNFSVKLDSGLDKNLNNLDIIPAQAITFSFGRPKNDAEVKDEVDKRIGKKLEKDEVLLPELIHYEVSQDNVSVIALAYRKADLNDWVAYKLNQVIATNQEALVSPNDVLSEKVATFKPLEQQAVLDIHLEKTIIPRLNLENLAKNLVNMPIDKAEGILADEEGVDSLKTAYSWCFFKKMPVISPRIRIKLDTF